MSPLVHSRDEEAVRPFHGARHRFPGCRCLCAGSCPRAGRRRSHPHDHRGQARRGRRLPRCSVHEQRARSAGVCRFLPIPEPHAGQPRHSRGARRRQESPAGIPAEAERSRRAASDALGSGEKVTIGLDYTVCIPAGSDDAYGLLARGMGPSPARPVRRFPGQRRELLLRPGFCPSRVRDCRPGTVTRRKAPGGRTDVSISLAPARDLSMAISKDWVRTERGQNGVTVASYMARDAEDSSRQVLSIALAALDCFGRRFGPYPLDALTFVSLPFDAYGCEFSGIVLVSARLHDPSFRVDHRPRGRPPMVLRDRGQRPAPGAVAEGTRRRSTAPSCRAGLRSSLR